MCYATHADCSQSSYLETVIGAPSPISQICVQIIGGMSTPHSIAREGRS